jgi:hypothetical protein
MAAQISISQQQYSAGLILCPIAHEKGGQANAFPPHYPTLLLSRTDAFWSMEKQVPVAEGTRQVV